MLQTTEDYKALKKVADVITSWDELQTLAIWLKLKPNIVSKLRNNNQFFRSCLQGECTELPLLGAFT